MFLADLPTIRASLGFDDMPDINAALASALDAAEEQLASRLQTEFAQQTLTDVFVVSESPTLGHSSQVRTEILLRQGFVQGTPTVAVTQNVALGTTNYFNVESELVNNNALPSNFTWNLEMGAGVDLSTIYNDAQLSVSYIAGFATDNSNPLSYNIISVPKWLQDAARLFTLIGIADMEIVTGAGIAIDKQSTQTQLTLLLGRKVRYRPLAFDPVA